jgi:hypothetical protein
MAGFVSISSVFSRASLNYRQLGINSENATSEARQSPNEKTTEVV